MDRGPRSCPHYSRRRNQSVLCVFFSFPFRGTCPGGRTRRLGQYSKLAMERVLLKAVAPGRRYEAGYREHQSNAPGSRSFIFLGGPSLSRVGMPIFLRSQLSLLAVYPGSAPPFARSRGLGRVCFWALTRMTFLKACPNAAFASGPPGAGGKSQTQYCTVLLGHARKKGDKIKWIMNP